MSGWKECRAWYLPAAKDVSGDTSQLFLQLLAGAGRGDFLDPAPGWLTLVLNPESAGSTVRLIGTPHPKSDEGEVYYADHDASVGFMGSAEVNTLQIASNDDEKKSSFDLNVNLSRADATYAGVAHPVRFGDGTLHASSFQEAPEPPANGGASGGNNCDACASAPQYQAYFQECATTNPPHQSACYCAAAYLKKCCSDPTWMEEADMAAKLNRTCNLP
jgi:hypothetical protein